MRLHTVDGARKYLTAGERDAFLRAAEQADRQVRTLCMTLAYAGCRLSEALALTADRVDLAAGVLVIESLKKRRIGIYRAVPVPPALLDALDLVQKWLGHAQLTTTALYADAVGVEEKNIARRMWG
jgi:integrase